MNRNLLLSVAVVAALLAGSLGALASSGPYANQDPFSHTSSDRSSYAIPALAPRPATGPTVTLVASAGGSNTGNAQTVSATLAAVTGDYLFAFVTEPSPFSTPVVADGVNSWAANATVTVGSTIFQIWVALSTATGPDTVTFTDTLGGGPPTLSVYDVNGSKPGLAHVSAGTTGFPSADSVWVNATSSLVGVYGVGTRPTGGISNDKDPSLTYDSAGSLTGSQGAGGLWLSPANGSGLTPVDMDTNTSTSGTSIAYSVDSYASAPPALSAAVASHGPSTCEAGICRVLFNGTATGGTNPYAFAWDWGDGSSVTTHSGNTTGSDRAVHSYAANGAYTVLLTVNDSASGTATDHTASVTVRPALLGTLVTNRSATCVVPISAPTCDVAWNTSLAYGETAYSANVTIRNASGIVYGHTGSNAATSFFNASLALSLAVGSYKAWYNATDGFGGVTRSTATIAVTTVHPATVPGAPTSLTVANVTATNVTLTWSLPGGGGLLNVTLYRGSECGTWTAAIDLGGAVTHVLVSGLTPKTAICFAVSAWNATGESARSATANTTTLAGGGGGGGGGGVTIAPFSWIPVLGAVAILAVIIIEAILLAA